MNIKEILKRYSWLIEKNRKCIISPDADGLISGLFMSEYLGWRVVGYYDNGKNLIIDKNISARECVFLDTEIFREGIRSIGHHIIRLRERDFPGNWSKFANCLNPNVL